MRLVLASHNPGKLAELRALFMPLGLELVGQGELAIAEPPEPHATFVENALAKARHAALAVGGPAIADDSGLCVEALGGEPGVASARWADVEPLAGEEREVRRRRQDAANNARLLERMHGEADRRARFVATLVAVRHALDPEPLVAVGRWPGTLLTAPRGQSGFGYDSLLFIADEAMTVAEMPPETKNLLSHRALAARRMAASMAEAWSLHRPSA